MASEVQICNRGLQRLGAKRIVSLSDDSVNARACNVAYADLRDAELQAHPWIFAIERAELAASATAPDWGRANEFPLPSDFLRLHPDYEEDNSLTKDWDIEGRSILSDFSDPIFIRYIKRVTDPNVMHVLFREALSCKLAWQLCEEITQSNTKLADIRADYKDIIKEARRANAIQRRAASFPDSSWLTVRA